jgi:hypothetical protein
LISDYAISSLISADTYLDLVLLFLRICVVETLFVVVGFFHDATANDIEMKVVVRSLPKEDDDKMLRVDHDRVDRRGEGHGEEEVGSGRICDVAERWRH